MSRALSIDLEEFIVLWHSKDHQSMQQIAWFVRCSVKLVSKMYRERGEVVQVQANGALVARGPCHVNDGPR